MAAVAPAPISSDSFLSESEMKVVQAKLNRLIRAGLIRAFPIAETGKLDLKTSMAMKAFCVAFAIDSTVAFGPGTHLSVPKKAGSAAPPPKNANALCFQKFNSVPDTFDPSPYLVPGSTAMNVLQWAVDHSEGPLSQMTPITDQSVGASWPMELATAMYTAVGAKHRPTHAAIRTFCSDHLPVIVASLQGAKQKVGYDLDRADFLVLALATIAAENSSLVPKDEPAYYTGPYNNSAYEDYDVYEFYDSDDAGDVKRLAQAKAKAEKEHPQRHPVRTAGQASDGNEKTGDGAKFKGRGWVQLTKRFGYRAAGEALGLSLVDKPDLVNDPVNDADILAWRIATGGYNGKFGAKQYGKICDEMARNQTTALRKMVNGGLARLDPFRDAYVAGRQYFRRAASLRMMRLGMKVCP